MSIELCFYDSGANFFEYVPYIYDDVQSKGKRGWHGRLWGFYASIFFFERYKK